MTVREIYESCLIELNKVLAPAVLLDDFIYYLNKAILEYYNKRYNLFEINLLLTDDLRVLSRHVSISKVSKTDYYGRTSWICDLPNDYVHILNCACIFDNSLNKKCNDTGYVRVPANKLDSNLANLIETNYYMLPSLKRPYFYMINIVDPVSNSLNVQNRETGNRYGNATIPKMQIRCGKAKLVAVEIDYLVAPQYLELTEELLDDFEDKTSNVEFPDYVINEIIKELVSLLLENAKDPRLQTFIPVNQSIPSQPAQTTK